MEKLKVILTDLDGVLRTFPYDHSGDVEKNLGMPEGSLLPIAFQKRFLDQVIVGKITDEEWRKSIIDELSKHYDSSSVKFEIERWTNYPGKLEEDVLSLYKQKKSDCKIALLTNATTKLNTDLKALGIFDLFDFIYNTSEIGFAKPDARTFHHVTRTIGYTPQEILFIDDRRENINIARELGFRVHLFENPQSLADILNWP